MTYIKKGYNPNSAFPKGHKYGIYTRTPATLQKQQEAAKRFHKKHPNYCKGENHPSWKGGKIISEGYVLIRQPTHPYAPQNGYVLEHRLVMEKKVGRYLERWEIVHHINGIRDDNRLCNLVLLPDYKTHFVVESLIKENKKLKREVKKWKELVRIVAVE